MMNPAVELLLGICCVAHFSGWFAVEQMEIV